MFGSILSCNKQSTILISERSCNKNDLIGYWLPVRTYADDLKYIDTIKIKRNWNPNTTSIIYKIDGTYVDDQLCYVTPGKYELNDSTCNLYTLSTNNDTLNSDINIIGNKYLIKKYKESNISYLYIKFKHLK